MGTSNGYGRTGMKYGSGDGPTWWNMEDIGIPWSSYVNGPSYHNISTNKKILTVLSKFDNKLSKEIKETEGNKNRDQVDNQDEANSTSTLKQRVLFSSRTSVKFPSSGVRATATHGSAKNSLPSIFK